MVRRFFLFLAVCSALSNRADAQSIGERFGLGVQIQDHVSPNKGVVVVGIESSSPAVGQLEVGDTINFIDGERVEDPELFVLFVQDLALRHGAGTKIELGVEKSIGRLYKYPQAVRVSVPIAYHGGNHDYARYRNSFPAFLAGILDGATYKFGAELYCLIEMALTIPGERSISPEHFANACVETARAAMDEYELAHPRTVQLGEMTGGVFFSIQDLFRKRAGKILGSETLGTCSNTITGEAMDVIAWLQREGVLEEMIEALQRGEGLERFEGDLVASGQLVVIGGLLQCTVLNN